jgi:hypothetical protein
MANAPTANRQSNSRQQGQGQQGQMQDPVEMGRDMVEYLREYARENPESAALWCLGIGFVLGWKLKIW